MGEQGSHEHEHTPETASGATAGSPQDRDNAHGAIADAPPVSQGRPEHRRNIAAGLIGALALTVVSLVFIASFIGALHAPGPRSVPVGVVGGPAQTSAVSRALDRQTPGGFNVIGYPNEPAARSAITGRIIDAALVPGPRVRLLLVATAVGQSVTAATVKDFGAAAHAARLPATVQNIRPLPPSDPDGLSQVFFVIALLAPSLIFGQQLVSRVSKDLPSLWQLAVIAVYAVIVAAAATAIADPAIGALTGAPWGLFGIGTLLAFAAAVMAAAATRWTGGIGYTVLLLLFIPVGIASSGTTIGPNMITQWYADLGKALLPGSAIPAIQNTVYFNGNNITRPAADLVLMGAGRAPRDGDGRHPSPAHAGPADKPACAGRQRHRPDHDSGQATACRILTRIMAHPAPIAAFAVGLLLFTLQRGGPRLVKEEQPGRDTGDQ